MVGHSPSVAWSSSAEINNDASRLFVMHDPPLGLEQVSYDDFRRLWPVYDEALIVVHSGWDQLLVMEIAGAS